MAQIYRCIPLNQREKSTEYVVREVTRKGSDEATKEGLEKVEVMDTTLRESFDGLNK